MMMTGTTQLHHDHQPKPHSQSFMSLAVRVVEKKSVALYASGDPFIPALFV